MHCFFFCPRGCFKNQAKLRDLGAAALDVLNRYCKYVEGNQLMKAIDMKEFADVTVHKPVMKALGFSQGGAFPRPTPITRKPLHSALHRN